ncbi:unnamed protein product [Thelazia callipaeda]|uniref:TPR_REGION domain-containing protein n=1 Tax=Thelazia callipaeda TaxID=103827 RepID=A0A158RD42_THECL|nr:unnamed protein product [Thelazia callipaeda]
MKTDLRVIRQHIDERRFWDAKGIIEDLLEQGVSDYLLFIFAAITYSEIEDSAKSVSYYKKAAELNPEKSLAWQGLFKLYEQGRYNDFSHILTVIQNLLTLSENSREKSLFYEREIGFVLLKMRKFDEAFSCCDRLNDTEFCETALKTILCVDSRNENYKDLIDKCLMGIDVSKLDATFHRKCAESRCFYAETLEEIWNVLSLHATYISPGDQWLIDLLRYLVVISYLKRNNLDCSNEVEMLKKNILEETEFETLLWKIQKAEMMSSVTSINERLSNNDCKWPYIGLIVPLLHIQERYEEVLTCLDVPISNKYPAITSSLDPIILDAKCQALYAIHDESAMGQLQVLLTNYSSIRPAPRNIRLSNVEMDDESKANIFHKEVYDSNEEELYWRAFLLKNSKSKDSLQEAKSLVESAIKMNSKSWQLLLLLGEICFALHSEDASAASAFVKAAKLNPHSSRAFYFLGMSVRSKNRNKAIACLQRAIKIRPKSTEVARLLDELLSLEDRKEERIRYLLQFTEDVPDACWARKRLSFLQMQNGNLDAAIAEMQSLLALGVSDASVWITLGDAYKKRGNYQTAIKAYKEAILLEQDNEIAQIQFIQMCQIMGQLDESIKQCLKLEEYIGKKQNGVSCVYLLHAGSLIKLAQKSSYSSQFVHLNEFFALIGRVFEQNPDLMSPCKFSADALLMASKFHIDTFKQFIFPVDWKIRSIKDALELAIHFYFVIVKRHSKCDRGWNDLGVAMVKKCQLTNDLNCAKFDFSSAIESFKRAILLCKSKTVKSKYWTNLSEAVAITRNDLLVQHCLIRALHLSIRNDHAWLLLGLLYGKYNKCGLARQAFLMAQKINPESAEIWCALAAMAELENDRNAMDLYRHSLTLKPTELAAKKYAYYLISNLIENHERDDAITFNFEAVHDIIGVSSRSDEFIFFVSLLAEFSWCMDYAAHYINNCHDWPDPKISSLHKRRIALRNMNATSLEQADEFQNLGTLYSSHTLVIYEKLLEEFTSYAHLFCALEQNNVEEFRAVLFKNKIQIPLFIAAVITFQKALSDDFISVLDDVRPGHRITMVFPPSKKCDENADFSFDLTEETSKNTLLRYDFMSKRLCDLLGLKVVLLRLSQATSTSVEVKEV